jgi:hypothetical protein
MSDETTRSTRTPPNSQRSSRFKLNAGITRASV